MINIYPPGFLFYHPTLMNRNNHAIAVFICMLLSFRDQMLIIGYAPYFVIQFALQLYLLFNPHTQLSTLINYLLHRVVSKNGTY